MEATNGVHGLLVTGDKQARDTFYRLVYNRLNDIQLRHSTAHYTCLSEDLEFALAVAGEHGLTVQEICHADGQETYPLLTGPGPGWQPEDGAGEAHTGMGANVRRCRVCGCTDVDCSGCVARTGRPCYWVAADLCSACERV